MHVVIEAYVIKNNKKQMNLSFFVNISVNKKQMRKQKRNRNKKKQKSKFRTMIKV